MEVCTQLPVNPFHGAKTKIMKSSKFVFEILVIPFWDIMRLFRHFILSPAILKSTLTMSLKYDFKLNMLKLTLLKISIWRCNSQLQRRLQITSLLGLLAKMKCRRLHITHLFIIWGDLLSTVFFVISNHSIWVTQ